MTDSAFCLCGSERLAAVCCTPLLAGERVASNAEELMRSRYTANVRLDVDYIVRTTLPEQQAGQDRAAIHQWASSSLWLGLEVLNVEGGSRNREAFVEFEVSYESEGERHLHRERSRFEKRAEQWFFDSQASRPSRVQARKSQSPGRNDACPCGSGKKFKKCCGA